MPPKLKYLKINQFRWVTPGCVLRFDDGLNFVLGRNGTGKTTLLDLIGAVWTGDFSAYAEEVLDVEMAFELSQTHSLRARLSNYDAAVDETPAWAWRIKAVLTIEGQESEIDISSGVDGHSHPMEDIGVIGASRTERANVPSIPVNPFSILHPDDAAPDTYHAFWADLYVGIQRASERWVARAPHALSTLDRASFVPHAGFLAKYHGSRYDEGLNWVKGPLESVEIVGRTNSAGLRPSALYATSPIGRQLIERLDSIVGDAEMPTSIELTADSLAAGLLGDLVRALEIARLSIRLDLELSEVERWANRGRSFRYHNPTIRITKKDGSTFSFDKLSHGQKRLFGLYWYLAASPQVLIADELANGLHYTMVEQILAGLGHRQSFLAMQDPLLLYPIDFQDLEQVKRRFVICELSEEDKLEWWTWRQLRDDEAAEFWEAYQAGIEHVPEILRSRGLW